MDSLSLREQLRDAWEAHGQDWRSPGFRAMAVHRYGRWAYGTKRPWRRLTNGLYDLLAAYVKNHYGIEFPRTIIVGRGFNIGHQHGMVIHGQTVFGDDCTIHHNVTFGVGHLSRGTEAPRLGDRVFVSPGATILGSVTIGDDVHIGPNALVISDVPGGSTVFAAPGRVLQLKRSRPEEHD